MSWTVEYLPPTDVVAITAVGEISNEDAAAQAQEVLHLLKLHQTNLVLADYGEALSEVTLPSLYGLPDYFTRCGGLWNIRVAVVMPRTQYRMESYQFFELVCKNAGYNVKLLAEREAAVAWLQHAGPGQPAADPPLEASSACLMPTGEPVTRPATLA